MLTRIRATRVHFGSRKNCGDDPKTLEKNLPIVPSSGFSMLRQISTDTSTGIG